MDIIELLIKDGLVTKEQVEQAKEETQRTGLSLEKALAKLGFITEENIASSRAGALGVPYMDLTDYLIDAALVKLLPENVAQKYKAVPLFKIGDTLTVAMLNPQDIVALDEIRNVSKMDTIEPVLATEKGIQKILDSYYGAAGSVDEIIKEVDKDKLLE